MTTRQFVTFLVVTVGPQQPPESSKWRSHTCHLPCFFKRTQFRLSTFAEGRHVEAAPDDVHMVQLSNFFELTQRLRNSSPLRSRVAPMNRGKRVCALSILGCPSEPPHDNQVFQADRVLT